jgi:hypothetical protein
MDKKMTKKEMEDFFSGKDEVELTDELIEKLVKEGKWKDVNSLKSLRDMGGNKWNVVRNTVIFSSKQL